MIDKFALQQMIAILKPLTLGDLMTFCVGIMLCDPETAIVLISELGASHLTELATALIMMRVKPIDAYALRPYKPTEFSRS